MSEYTIKPLGPDTWEDFAGIAERHNGVWNGCWCTWFHTLYADKDKERTADSNCALKARLVNEGQAHAALVFDGDLAVAWCQYGSPEELPNINHRKEYEAGLDRLPDYRITCFFVDKKYRRKGLAAVALEGALDLIAQAGGGVVEAYPHIELPMKPRICARPCHRDCLFGSQNRLPGQLLECVDWHARRKHDAA